MIKDYKINSHNSTVNGSPGRLYDWSKFDWNQETEHDFGDLRYSTDSDFVPDDKKGHLIGKQKAYAPYTDGYLIARHCQYLHVPYDWAESGTVYRVRPNDTMYTGEIYRGNLVTLQEAIKKEDGWYWRLHLSRFKPTIDVDVELWKQVKIRTVTVGVTIQEWLDKVIKEALEKPE